MTSKANIVYFRKGEKTVIEESCIHIHKVGDLEWVIDFIKDPSGLLLLSLKITTVTDVIVDTTNWTEIAYRALCVQPDRPNDSWPSIESHKDLKVLEGITTWGVLDIKIESQLTDQVLYICTGYEVPQKDPIILTDYILFKNKHDGSIVKNEVVVTHTGLWLKRSDRHGGNVLHVLKTKYPVSDISRVEVIEGARVISVEELYRNPDYTENRNTMRVIKIGDFEYLQSFDGQIMFTFQSRAVKKLSHQIYTYITTTDEFNEHTRRTLKDALNNILVTSSFYPEIKPEAILTDLFTMWTLVVELRSTLHQINGVGYDRMNPKRL